MAKADLTAQRLRELVQYDPDTGNFFAAIDSQCGKGRIIRCAGTKLGTVSDQGYIKITVHSRYVLAHRLAWLYITGEWPANGIDHKDGNPSNNAFANLRDVTPRINSENQRRARSDNSNGLLGVTNSGAKFRAGIQISGKKLHLGSFDTPNSAHQAYLSAKRRMHEGNTL